MIKMSYLNKRIASLGVATALTLTMSSCASSKHKAEIIPNETTIEKVLDDDVNKETNTLEENIITETSSEPEFVFDPSAESVVPIETVIMENGEIGYKMPQFYFPYLVDENYPMPGWTAILDITDEYKVLSGCDMINPDGTTTYCSFEGSVGVYYPYWLLLGLDREKCSEAELELINIIEASAKQTYDEQTKANIKK